MKVSKGLATWAGIVAACGQYLAAVAVFLEADNQSDALGPLVTATATLLAVIVGRMQQAKALASRPAAPAPVTFSTPMTSGGNLRQAITDAVSGGIGGNLGIGGASKGTGTAYSYGSPASVPLGTPTDLSKEIPGGSVLPDGERA